MRIADEPRAFADAVISLLRDARRRQSLGAAARQLVVNHYDWSAAAGVLDAALTQCVARSPYVIKPQDPGAASPASPGRRDVSRNNRDMRVSGL